MAGFRRELRYRTDYKYYMQFKFNWVYNLIMCEGGPFLKYIYHTPTQKVGRNIYPRTDINKEH